MNELTAERLTEIKKYISNVKLHAGFDEEDPIYKAFTDLPILVAEVERLNDELKGATLLDESNVRVCRALQSDLSAAQKRITALENSMQLIESDNQEMELFLMRQDYKRCDIAACNCGSWHKRTPP